MTKAKNTERVLVIGDLHTPFEHEDYLAHCKAVAKQYKTTHTIFIGDVIDAHFSSYHETNPDGYGAGEELERASQHPSKRCPTYVYIDEVGDYIDPTVNIILEQTRKYKIALTMAHQQLAQLPPEVRASVATNTSIKFIGSVSSEDARALADNMRTTWETLRNQKRLHFSLYVRGYLHAPCTITVTPGRMEGQPRRTPEEMQELLDSTRQRYSSNQPRTASSPAPSRGFVEKPRRTPDPRFTEAPPTKKPDIPDDDIEFFRKR